MDIPFKEFVIASEVEAQKLVDKKPFYWNVISIWSGGGGKHGTIQPHFPKAASVHQERFHDINRPEEGRILCTINEVDAIRKYARAHHGEPLLIHCHAGISRSTAIAFLIVLDALKDKVVNPAEEAMRYVYQKRPIMVPNRHIIDVGIPAITLSDTESMRYFRELYNSTIMGRITG